ncbi:uncharacterized protein METZ01_LOCUS377673, partial [marine metagenome]
STSFFLTLLFETGLLRGSSRRSNARVPSSQKAWSTLNHLKQITNPMCLKPGTFTEKRKLGASRIASINSARGTH